MKILIGEQQLENLISKLNYPVVKDKFQDFLVNLSKGEIDSVNLNKKLVPKIGPVSKISVKLDWDKISPEYLDEIEGYLERKYSKHIQDFLNNNDRVFFDVLY